MMPEYPRMTPPEFVAFVREHVWTDTELTQDFVLNCFPKILSYVRLWIREEHSMLELLKEAIYNGLDADEVACWFVPAIVECMSVALSSATLCLNLLLLLAQRVNTKDLMADVELFHTLVDSGFWLYAVRIVHFAKLYDVHPDNLARLVLHVSNQLRFPLRVDERLCLSFFCNLLDGVRGAEWRFRLIDRVVQILRARSWSVLYDELWVRMLDTTSVQLVLALHATSQLSTFIGVARDHHNYNRGQWSRVWAHLCRHWPARTDKNSAPPTNYICPITLDACCKPVVASDGRVYERNAIVQHMALNGPISPMTRAVISYDLFPLFV